MKTTLYIVKKDVFDPEKYYGCNGQEFIVIKSECELKPEKIYELIGKYTNYTFRVEAAEQKTDKKLEASVKQFLFFQPATVKEVVKAPLLIEMKELFNDAAVTLTKAVLELRTIKIRYDGDGDGISSGIILKKCLEKFAKDKKVPLLLRTQESYSAVYSEKDCEEDKGLAEGSLLVLLDHGANQESKENLCRSAKNFEIMVVDHHPPAIEPCIDHFVSPFQLKNPIEPSSYNTGLLAFEIARRICPELEPEFLRFCRYSMQTDTSSFRESTFFPEGVVIDYLAVSSIDPYSLEFYDKTLSDKHLVGELYREEKLKTQRALEKAIHKAKTYTGKYTLVTCDVTGIAKKNSYPSISKLHNALQFHFAEKGPTASLVYTGDSLSFRANRSAADLGFSAHFVIKALKETYGKSGFTGGGHDVASSSRFPKEYAKQIITTAINLVMQNGQCS